MKMTTMTITKLNYFDVIQKINTMLFREKKIMISLDSIDEVQNLYDDAKKEYKEWKTIYWWTVTSDDN